MAIIGLMSVKMKLFVRGVSSRKLPQLKAYNRSELHRVEAFLYEYTKQDSFQFRSTNYVDGVGTSIIDCLYWLVLIAGILSLYVATTNGNRNHGARAKVGN